MPEGGKLKEILESGQAPYGFVRGGGAASQSGRKSHSRPYWTRSNVADLARHGSQQEVEASLPEQVKVDALMDKTHTDSNKRDVIRDVVQKVDNETMLRAQGQIKETPEIDPELKTLRETLGET